MPVKNQYSHIIEPPKFVDPIDLTTYAQGTMYKENIAKNNISAIGNTLNSFASIPAFGVDQQKLQEKVSGLKQQLGSMNLSNLGDFNTISQLNGIVSQVKNDPEIMAIAQRGNFYQNELKKQQEFADKGKEYISPGMEALGKYYNGQDFLTKPNISLSQGFVSPDLIKYQEAAQKITPKQKIWKTLPNGERMQVESQNKEDLANTYYNLLGQDPNGGKYLDYQFEQNHKDVDWDNAGNQKIYEDLQKLELAKQEAASMGYSTETFDNQIARLNRLSESGATGIALKSQYKDNYIKDFVNTWADGVDYIQQGDIKLDELDKMRLEHAYRINEIQERATQKAIHSQNINDKVKNQVRAARLKAASSMDLDISDPNSPDGYVSDEVLDSYGLAKAEKEKSAKDTKIQVGEKSFKLKDVEQNIRGGNKEMVKQLINQYIESTEDGEDVEIKDGKIFYEKKVGLEMLRLGINQSLLKI